MNYKLSICIPTYNRAKYLPDLLDSILKQVDLQTPIEICVSDNASEDGTQALIAKYKNDYPHLVYFCAPQNMGADINYLKAISLASGEYCWLMGSDDKVESGAIAYILQLLQKYPKLTGMSLNRYAYDVGLTSVVYEFPIFKSPPLGDIVFTDEAEIFAKLGDYFGYISGQVVNRNVWEQMVRSHDLTPFYNSYVHVYVIGLMLKVDPRWLFVNKRCVGWRSGNDSFLSSLGRYKRMQIDIVGYDAIARELFGQRSKIYKKLTNKVLTVHVKAAVKGAKFDKINNFVWPAFKLTLRYYWKYPAFWLILMPYYLMPSEALLWMRSFYRKFIKNRLIKKNMS